MPLIQPTHPLSLQNQTAAVSSPAADPCSLLVVSQPAPPYLPVSSACPSTQIFDWCLQWVTDYTKPQSVSVCLQVTFYGILLITVDGRQTAGSYPPPPIKPGSGGDIANTFIEDVGCIVFLSFPPSQLLFPNLFCWSLVNSRQSFGS